MLSHESFAFCPIPYLILWPGRIASLVAEVRADPHPVRKVSLHSPRHRASYIPNQAPSHVLPTSGMRSNHSPVAKEMP